MAQTGMETSEIVMGVVAETKPDLVIAVDALAARSIRRLNRTVQITDTGIHPGSGVGNHRIGLTEENLQVKVIGIGVPTVVDAATIVHDSMEHLLDALEEQEQKEFLEEMIAPNLYSMFVTPKDVDETVKYLSFTTVSYTHLSMDTAAGTIDFSDEAGFVRAKNRYLLLWNDGMILPDLTPSDKVSVVMDKAKRGRILDRNGKTLAGPGLASSVGLSLIHI